MHFNLNALENFFGTIMPSTKKLIEDLWFSDRKELIEILNEYITLIGARGYGYQYFVDMKEHAEAAPHDYTDPWKVL